MPIYSFENIKTGEEYTEQMSMAELDTYLKKNKNVRQVFNTLNIVGGVSGLTHKPDSGWNDTLQKIAEKHPGSPLAEKYRKKSIKEIKTKQVIDKHRKRKNGR
jgi:hypothetical protein